MFQNPSLPDLSPSEHTAEMRGLRVLRLIEHLAAANHPQTLSPLAFCTRIPKVTMMRACPGPLSRI